MYARRYRRFPINAYALATQPLDWCVASGETLQKERNQAPARTHFKTLYADGFKGCRHFTSQPTLRVCNPKFPRDRGREEQEGAYGLGSHAESRRLVPEDAPSTRRSAPPAPASHRRTRAGTSAAPALPEGIAEAKQW